MPRSNKPVPGGLELRLLHTDQYKSLIHWRLERKENETQRFYLHAGTDQEYVSQILAERLEQDRKGKRYWKQIRAKNHFLDCEVGNAALADGEWLPSLKMLAAYLKQQQEAPKPVNPLASKKESPLEDRREFTRPGWLNR
jgi:phage terminase large subunit GpA-like protein